MEEEINEIELHKRRSLKDRNLLLQLRIILITKNTQTTTNKIKQNKIKQL
jgi:hypothetical protein